MKKLAFSAIAALGLAVALPTGAAAQDYPMKPAEYVTVTSISIKDGHMLDYANHLATLWRRSQDFAVEQGWIESYEVLGNIHRRKGEPDVYLITRFREFSDPEESEARDKAYEAHMAMTNEEMLAASKGRAEYRTVEGEMLLRRFVWTD